jgi:alkylation response protein AidB-like acyl-CoA dehydrogenase
MAANDDAHVDLDLLRESARDFLSGRDGQDSVKELAAMDWTGLLTDEELGGSGWRPVETTVIAEELGRAQNSSPWFGCVIAAAAVSTAPADVRDRWLPGMLDGTTTAACTLAGDVVRAIAGDTVELVITLGRNGINLIETSDVIDRHADPDLLDVNRVIWNVDISSAPETLIGGPERADQLLALARVLLSADSLGALAMTFERLVGYLKERVAFGVPIASFQAVQHRLVELLVVQAKARAVVMKSARALAADLDVAEDVA